MPLTDRSSTPGMVSVVIPALNEAQAIAATVEQVRSALTASGITHEIIVVDDGSTDGTGDLARAAGAVVMKHPARGGYGRSLKDGILAAKGELIAITDADGTYPNLRLPDLIQVVAVEGFDMAVGARTGEHYRGSVLKMPARRVFLWLSEYATGSTVPDINSGLRVFRRDLALRYMHTISDRFSFTTTITLAAMLNGYFVKYVPIEYFARVGHSSHVRYRRDTLRALQIIVENILYYNPLKLFLLIVNALAAMTVVSLAGFAISDSPKLSNLFATFAATSAVGAAVVAALGLVANLVKLGSVPGRFSAVPRPEQRPAPDDVSRMHSS